MKSMYMTCTVYKPFVLPILDYCDVIRSYCGRVNADKLERLQRRAARYVSGEQRKRANFLGLRNSG